MSKNTLTPKKLKLLCFGLDSNDEMIRVLLNGFDYKNFHKYVSRMDLSNPDDYAKLEKLITGIWNCAEVFGKELENPVASLMLQPYLYVDFSKEIKTIEELVDFYIFKGKCICDMTKNTEGIVMLNVKNAAAERNVQNNSNKER